MDLWHELNAIGKTVGIVLVLSLALTIGFGVSRLFPSARLSYLEQMAAASLSEAPDKTPIIATHIMTPTAVKAVYMTACTASVPRLRAGMLGVIDGTEINSIIIDLKDYTGTIAYDLPAVDAPRGSGCRISDLPKFLAGLHSKNIYAIARVTVFQDPLYAAKHPDIAVGSVSRPGQAWKDRNGLAYIDPNYPAYWKHIVSIARGAYAVGFDEINFDYIRFPSDGVMEDAKFATPSGVSKSEVMSGFFAYLYSELSPEGIITSADLFGQTTVNRDDLGIGQILEDALPYFDYVSPMNYPSHFAKGFMGYANPAEKPYEVMRDTMVMAVERAVMASSSISKLRPWLQAFDLGAKYTPEMINLQKKGVYDAGLTSWMLWDAANRYKKEAL